ncbi:MAG TPA: hypothetical protein VFS21_29705 [Roseiflexaceae bacterium]|nr:hypothetical protein [Roseiflexaceae bacterium]
MSDRRVTIPRSIRMTPEELERAQQLLPNFPEVASEAELLRQAMLIGLYVLAAEAPDLGGYDPALLARLLRYRLVGAIDLLVEQAALPALHRLVAEREHPVVAAEEGAGESAPATPQIDASAAAELSDLGIDFLE